MNKRLLMICIYVLLSLTAIAQQRVYLSGHGCDDMTEWDFQLDDGPMTKIGVPSCWEMQGFGCLQYGWWFNKWHPSQLPEDSVAREVGHYLRQFELPKEWQGQQIEIVFEAVMTDAEVRINGLLAGEIHQGGFSPFRYDITQMVKTDRPNLLGVTVWKESHNPQVNRAERRADFWNFGGIIRPVYLEARPVRGIQRAAINAGSDGRFEANVHLNHLAKAETLEVEVGGVRHQQVAKGDSLHVDFTTDHPNLWTAETPYLYTATFTLKDRRGQILHQLRQRFGFRTVELRERDGLYVNGQRVKLKGVNRHAFRPGTGRTLSYEKNLEDVQLIKSMNMNAVRLSHYPADADFYDICDSLGLYVLDEVTGWQTPHDTLTGKRLVAEMVKRDVNHPCILFWDSGNEGGFNYALEPVFHQYDPQHRTVIYPWLPTHNGINTRHYRSYRETQKILASGDVFMPTEFLHAAYDGGGGAGLRDYWELMGQADNCAGGFIWALIDEGVQRGDTIDCAGNLGPDGLVGPHHEREGSYYTVKQLWSPVQIVNDPTSGVVELENRYDFRNLSTCRLHYRYTKLPAITESGVQLLAQGTLGCPAAQSRQRAQMALPQPPAEANQLELTITNSEQDTLYTWAYAFSPVAIGESALCGTITTVQTETELQVEADGLCYMFSLRDGNLMRVEDLHLAGPRVMAIRRADRPMQKETELDPKLAASTKNDTCYEDSSRLASWHFDPAQCQLTFTYEGGLKQQMVWTFLADRQVRLDYQYQMHGWVDAMGLTFDYPESLVKSKQWVGRGPYRVWQNRLDGPQRGYWQTDYNDARPGESFCYPEFKGYFSDVEWMRIETTEGTIGILPGDTEDFVGVYTPEDGRDHFLYDFPASGPSLLKYIPAVRNKVDYSDQNGPSAQPHWVDGTEQGSVTLKF